MKLFEILKNIYCNRNSKWIKDIPNEDISPLIINRFLAMNDKVIKYVSYLNKFTFRLNSKTWLYLCWSIIPKQNQMPFVKFLKVNKTEDIYNPIWKKIRKVLELSDNDFKYCKPYLLSEIEKDKKTWFKKFGMDEKFWNIHGIDFNGIKEGGVVEGKGGLELFGL